MGLLLIPLIISASYVHAQFRSSSCQGNATLVDRWTSDLTEEEIRAADPVSRDRDRHVADSSTGARQVEKVGRHCS